MALFLFLFGYPIKERHLPLLFILSWMMFQKLIATQKKKWATASF